MTEEKLKLFEFSELGFFAARDKDHAFALCEMHTGSTAEELDLDNDFKRVVPDDEEIDVSAEDSWEDPRERTEAVVAGSRSYTHYHLKITAAEWANNHPASSHGEHLAGAGYAFGGEG